MKNGDNYSVQISEMRRDVQRVQEQVFARLTPHGWVVFCPTGGVPGELGDKYWDWKYKKWVNNIDKVSYMTHFQAKEVLCSVRTWLQNYEEQLHLQSCSNVVDS